MIKTVLIVGFGNIGLRHTQSLINAKEDYKLSVVDPDILKFNAKIETITDDKNNIQHFTNLDEINKIYDLVIIATTADIRFDVFEKLILKGNKKFLLEKVVFQSVNQFEKSKELIKKYNVKTYCNFVRRYYDNHQLLKERLYKGYTNLEVLYQGNDFGLACNALHIIDLFQFWVNEPVSITKTDISINSHEHQRGKDYYEILGTIFLDSKSGHKLTICAKSKTEKRSFFSIKVDDDSYIIDEQLKNELYIESNTINQREYTQKYTSALTSIIVDDINNNKCILPSVLETEEIHSDLIKNLNTFFKKEGIQIDNKCCPIT